MTRFLIRLISRILLGCALMVLLGLGVGRALREDEISFSAKNPRNGFSIYLMSLSRHMMRQLTYSTYDIQFAWSPDGQFIAVVRERDNSPTIYLMNINGQKVSPLNSDPQNAYAPAWSPDGHSVVYVSSHPPASNELAITNLDTGATRYLRHGDHDVSNPTWSPDGKHMIFVSQPPNVVGAALYDMDVVSEKISLLTSAPGYYMNAIWSPNNRYLLYTQAQPKAALYITNGASHNENSAMLSLKA
jgi:Tol biopolymer transport system component